MPRLEADLAEDVNLEKEGGNTYPDGDGEGEEEEESLELLSTVDYIFTDSEDAQKEDEMQTELSMEDLKEAFRWIWGTRFQSWHIDWIYFWLKIVWWSGARIHHCHPIPGEKWRSTHNFAEHNVLTVCILANLHRVGTLT